MVTKDEIKRRQKKKQEKKLEIPMQPVTDAINAVNKLALEDQPIKAKNRK